MKKITILIPDDCPVQDAIMHVSGCFNETQLDYRNVKEGFRNGVGLRFGNNRSGYFYCTKNGYVLKLNGKGQ